MQWKTVELVDKPVLTYFFNIMTEVSYERSFTDIMLWQYRYRVEYVVDDDFLCIRSHSHDGSLSYFFPIGEGDVYTCLVNLIDDFEYYKHSKPGLTLFKMQALTKNQKAKLEKFFPNRFVINPAKDQYDYVYHIQNLINLTGAAYHSKKNHINRFKRSYQYKYETLSIDNIEILLSCYDRFYSDTQVTNLHYEQQGLNFLLNHYQELNYDGGLLFVDDELTAFTLGEQLSSDMFVIHIEKANRAYLGAYQMINQLFLINNCKDFHYVNRANDAGVPSLAKAKLSYHPSFFIMKYIAVDASSCHFRPNLKKKGNI
jgi:hypothetical protein